MTTHCPYPGCRRRTATPATAGWTSFEPLSDEPELPTQGFLIGTTTGEKVVATWDEIDQDNMVGHSSG
jgi:hypothetical protein